MVSQVMLHKLGSKGGIAITQHFCPQLFEWWVRQTPRYVGIILETGLPISNVPLKIDSMIGDGCVYPHGPKTGRCSGHSETMPGYLAGRLGAVSTAMQLTVDVGHDRSHPG